MDPFEFVPIFISLIFVIILCGLVYTVISGLAEWVRNNGLPIKEEAACIVAKRSDVRGGMSHLHSHLHSHRRTSTYYFVTFELDSGERVEFGVPGTEYGLLVEGDEGMRTYQGTRYHGFHRRK